MAALVEPAFVAERLNDPKLALLDATLPPVGVVPAPDVHGRYRERHLPGALFFDIEALSDRESPLPHMLPSPEIFARAMGKLGLSEEMTFVVYEQAGLFSAPRAWWMLKTFGVRKVHVLNGGLCAWTEAGLPVASGEVHRTEAVFRAALNTDGVRNLRHVQDLITSGGQIGQIVDARPAARFEGAAPEPRHGLRSGHMPGAINVPLSTLAQGGRMKAPAELVGIFRAKGIDLAKPITTTCGSGVTAAGVALALELCEAGNVSLYDGSWAEYAQQAEAVIEIGEGLTQAVPKSEVSGEREQ